MSPVDNNSKEDPNCGDDDGKILTPSTVSTTTLSANHQNQHYKVVIIGAGASGLQCCNTLVKQYNVSIDDVLILEARSRIGGRIYTTFETSNVVGADDHHLNRTVDSKEELQTTTTSNTTTFALDHGAAWVHGTGFEMGTTIPPTINDEEFDTNYNDEDDDDDDDESSSDDDDDVDVPNIVNPMMYLLEQHASTIRKMRGPGAKDTTTTGGCGPKDDTKDNYTYEDRFFINPIVDGNPWMRPRSVLHTKGQLGLYVAGQYIGNNEQSSDADEKNDPMIIHHALQRHYGVLRHVQTIGNDMYDNGRGMETTTTSLADTIKLALTAMQQKEQDQDDTKTALIPNESEKEKMIAAIAPFYMLLLECWYGCEVSAMQLNEFVENKVRVIDREDDIYTKAGDFVGPHCTIQNGMISVLQPLLKNGIQERILCNQDVIKILYHQEESPQTITTTPNRNGTSTTNTKNCISIQTASGLQVTADTCVVTIPAGCLKDAVMTDNVFSNCADGKQISFSPAKMEAISLLKMGSYKKVFLTFDRIFWPSQPAFIGLVRHIDHGDNDTNSNDDGNYDKNEMYYKTTSTHPMGNCLLVDNLWAKRGIASMEVVLFGTAGMWSIGRSDTELCDVLFEFISDSMNIPMVTLHEYYLSCHVTRWEEDKYSRGAYSSTALGTLPRHLRELRRPEWDDRLIISGEATISEYDGSVFAALYSGMNAAKSIHNCLAKEMYL